MSSLRRPTPHSRFISNKFPLRISRTLAAVAVISVVYIFGAVGYMILGLSLLDAAYQTAITIFTVGFVEVTTESGATVAYRLFTLVLVLAGVSTVLFASGIFVESLVENRAELGRGKRMQRQIDEESDHLIVCGYGRVGKSVVARSLELDENLVVVERSEAAVAEGVEEGLLFVRGDATHDDVLIQAGVERAVALVGALETDADNLFLAISARRLNPDLRIVVRANGSEAAEKLRTMDIETVVEPYQIAGARLATAAIRPHISEYIDQVFSSEVKGVELVEISIRGGSPLVGQTVGGACPPGTLPIAIRRSGESEFFSSGVGEHLVSAGDVLIALGDHGSAELLRLRAADLI
jgi:voltage-gated potassium channel